MHLTFFVGVLCGVGCYPVFERTAGALNWTLTGFRCGERPELLPIWTRRLRLQQRLHAHLLRAGENVQRLKLPDPPGSFLPNVEVSLF